MSISLPIRPLLLALSHACTAKDFHLINMLVYIDSVAAGTPWKCCFFRISGCDHCTMLHASAVETRVAIAKQLKANVKVMDRLRGEELDPQKPDFRLMEQLHAAGILRCPSSGMPVLNVRACSETLKRRIWAVWCTLAECINKSTEHEQAATALEELRAALQAEGQARASQ